MLKTCYNVQAFYSARTLMLLRFSFCWMKKEILVLPFHAAFGRVGFISEVKKYQIWDSDN
jgi:hypothetical protein